VIGKLFCKTKLFLFQFRNGQRPGLEGPPEGVLQSVHRANRPDHKIATSQRQTGFLFISVHNLKCSLLYFRFGHLNYGK
jgi:hypothetical protein